MILSVVVPVYNEHELFKTFGAALVRFLDQSPSNNAYHLIIVDDGSTIPVEIDTMAKQGRVSIHLLRHACNLGQGAALQTGIAYARDVQKSDVFITMDADGQHDPEDLPQLLSKLDEGSCDIVFGNRFSDPEKLSIPTVRRMVLRLAVVFENLLTGLKLADAHNGYRAFNAKCAKFIILKQNRMAHATEFKQIVAKNKLRYSEVPVEITYGKLTMAKGQRNIGSFVILKDLLYAYLFNR